MRRRPRLPSQRPLPAASCCYLPASADAGVYAMITKEKRAYRTLFLRLDLVPGARGDAEICVIRVGAGPAEEAEMRPEFHDHGDLWSP